MRPTPSRIIEIDDEGQEIAPRPDALGYLTGGIGEYVRSTVGSALLLKRTLDKTSSDAKNAFLFASATLYAAIAHPLAFYTGFVAGTGITVFLKDTSPFAMKNPNFCLARDMTYEGFIVQFTLGNIAHLSQVVGQMGGVSGLLAQKEGWFSSFASGSIAGAFMISALTNAAEMLKHCRPDTV